MALIILSKFHCTCMSSFAESFFHRAGAFEMNDFYTAKILKKF